jgi:hypothetical protein
VQPAAPCREHRHGRGRGLRTVCAGRRFSLTVARRLLRERVQAAGYRCDQPPGLLSQTFAASKFCSVLMYTALCTYDACVMSCSGEVTG